MVLFDNQIYLLDGEQEESDFMQNPQLYFINDLANYSLAKFVSEGSLLNQDVQLKGHCPVEATKGNLKIGSKNIMLEYKGQYYVFANVKNQMFFLT